MTERGDGGGEKGMREGGSDGSLSLPLLCRGVNEASAAFLLRANLNNEAV